jgi:hypothetical protein
VLIFGCNKLASANGEESDLLKRTLSAVHTKKAIVLDGQVSGFEYRNLNDPTFAMVILCREGRVGIRWTTSEIPEWHMPSKVSFIHDRNGTSQWVAYPTADRKSLEMPQASKSLSDLRQTIYVVLTFESGHQFMWDVASFDRDVKLSPCFRSAFTAASL